MPDDAQESNVYCSDIKPAFLSESANPSDGPWTPSKAKQPFTAAGRMQPMQGASSWVQGTASHVKSEFPDSVVSN
jgi:hypothetical protein